jgi:hypothetical protein
MTASGTRPVPSRGQRLLDFAGRHELLAATLAFVVIASLWFWPLFTGDQMGQSFTLDAAAPWKGGGDRSGLPERAFFIDASLQFEPWATIARNQVLDGHLPLWKSF